jgi:hypothetical protein
MSDILACACSADVYNEPGLNENGEEEGAVIEVRPAEPAAGDGLPVEEALKRSRSARCA